ncbi:hypothetical protein DPMN_081003 [Dreissena polymorpha]|uniref:Uncharacterized protein n=1 Tax=Dreissena polymorpha TaxID=45954 RepID=A0A9D3Y7V0_DREPO|nr:hypothetical protein DPMN_081003 [Dreissena polymorpha]
MAPDTKVPEGRTDGRTAGRTAGRTDNAKTISLRLWWGIMKSAKALPRYGSGHKSAYNMAPDTKVPEGRTDSRTDSRTDRQRQNNIPPPKRFQDMAPDTKVPIFQRNPPKHFQDMAPDTKVPDGRTTPKQYPSASGGG